MLQAVIKQIVSAQPEYAAITPVIEKEILHHDIFDYMISPSSITFRTSAVEIIRSGRDI